MPVRKIRRLLSAGLRILWISLALCALQLPAAGQPWLYDASYVSYWDEEGGQNLELWVEYGSYSYYDYAYYGSVWMPGLVIPDYNDCNCSAHFSDVYYGDYGFYADGPYSYSSTEWDFHLYWYIYVPAHSPTECSGCLTCENPHDESVYWEYYDTVWAWIAVIEH